MQELIKITQDAQGINTVNARDLHLFLEVKSEFRNWVKNRIDDFGFSEGSDFMTTVEIYRGGERKDYHLTLDMAKELSMVERNDKGKHARLYFIEREKMSLQSFSVPKTMSEALRLAADLSEKNEAQALQIEMMSPKAEFFDAVTGSSDAIDIGSVAKVLNMGIGRNNLFEFLRNEKILQDRNSPFQRYVDAGYFRIIEQSYDKPDGSTHISLKTVVYQSGVNFIRKRLIASQIGK